MLPMIKARYYARAIGCYFGRAGVDGDGNAQVFVQFEVVEHPEFNDERITWAGTFGEGKSTGFTLAGLNNLGWQGDDLSELDNLDADGAARLLPDIVELSCDVDTYNEETKLKVNWVNKPGGQRMTKHPLTGAGLKAFAAQMRGSIRGAGGGAQRQTSTRTEPQHPNAPGGTDDIPF